MKTACPKFVYFLAAIFLLAGCSGHPRRVSVTLNGVPTTVTPNQVVTITATVNDDKTGDGVTWAVTGAGTFTSTTTSLTYTAPSSVPENPVVSVMATSIAKPTASATAMFTIASAAVSVQITNPITTVTVGTANVTINATVTNDVNNQGVTWALVTGGTTTACAPACGTIVTSTSTSVTYMPPTTLPDNTSAALIATSVADTTQSATDAFTIQPMTTGNLGYLNGPYAMEASGFDEDGKPLTLAGSFTADGNGTIVTGEFDVNDNFSVSTVIISIDSGTYTLDSNLRGTITFNTPLPGFSETPTFAFTIDSATNNGVIISADEGEQAVSGLIAAQSASVFSATPSGSFIFRGSSDAAGVREGEAGQMTIGSSGSYTGLIDVQDIGDGNRAAGAAINGTFSAADVDGRGSFTLNGGAEANSSYVYYAISPTKFFILEDYDEALFMNVGVARVQNLSSFNANSPNGVGVFGLIGGDNDGEEAVFSSVAVGQLTITGGANASVVCDLNDSGSISQCDGSGEEVKKAAGSIKPNVNPTPITGTVTFDTTSGRGTITFPGGYNDGFIDAAVFYLEANGAGVLLDATPITDEEALPEAFVGDWIPQTGTSDIVGQVQGVGLIAEIASVAIEGEANIAVDGTTNGLFDGAIVDSQPILDSSVTGTFSASDTNGRSTATLQASVLPNTSDFAAYEVSPTQFFIIGETNNVDSPLGIFNSQTLPQQPAVKKPAAAAGVTTTKPAVQKAVTHHGRQRRNATQPHQLPAR